MLELVVLVEGLSILEDEMLDLMNCCVDKKKIKMVGGGDYQKEKS